MTQSVRAAIDAWLAREQHGRSVAALRCRPWEYTTSAPLELVTVELDDGGTRDFVLKHLGRRALSEQVRRAKPSFVIEPTREIEVYRRLLAPLQIGPRLVGSGMSDEDDAYWLLIEYVPGYPLYEAGDSSTWVAAARELRSIHERLCPLNTALLRQQVPLIEHNRDWYTEWLKRALRFFEGETVLRSRRTRSALSWLAARHDRVVERLMALPRTIIHGEFYPSNVLVTDEPGIAVYAIDWEMSAIGPRVMDLAALTAGHWSEHDRGGMIAAYADGSTSRALDELTETVAYAQIQLAVQWLGWFGRRQAPAEHARDWLSEAVDRAEALEL